MTAPHPPAHSPLSKFTDELAAKAHELELLTKLLESLAACTTTADDLCMSMRSKGMGGMSMNILCSPSSTSSPSSVSESNTFGDPDRTPPQRGKVAMPANFTANLEVNPKGPHDKFVPGELSLDGRRQAMYNGFIFDMPHHDPTGKVYLVTRGWRVSIFASCTSASPHTNRCSGAVCVKVASLDKAIVLLMDTIDSGDACWLK